MFFCKQYASIRWDRVKKDSMNWLKHLEEAVPVEGYGNRLSMYLIDLEAWRRGVTVNFFTEPNPENKLLIRYSLHLGNKQHKFVSSQGDLLTKEAYEICDNKHLTKQYLKKAGVKTPEGKRFPNAIDTHDEMLEYAVSLGFPVVVKPINENAGKGVFSNIHSKEELTDILEYLCHSLGYTDLIVEEYIAGTEYRVLTVGDQIVAAVNRIPANVVGDGEKTIEELIKEKNRMKRNNPNLSKKTIQIDKEVLRMIERADYELNSVPPNGEKVFLRTKSNISSGGDPIDVTDQLTEEQKTAARKAAQVIPGLSTSGMDLIIDPDDQSPTIIEVNTKPMIGLHVFPMEGKSRDVVKELVDYYFPETKNGPKTSLFFDFEKTISSLDNITVKSVNLNPPPSLNKIYAKKVILYGEGFNSQYRNLVRLEALKYNLHGYVKKVDNTKMELLIGNEDPSILDSFISECHDLTEEAIIQEIKELEWDKPIGIGFKRWQETRAELKDTLKKSSLTNQKLEDELKKIKNKNRTTKQKYDALKRKNKKIIDDNDELKEDNSELKTEIEKRKKRYSKIKKQKRNLLNTNEDLTKEIQVLNQELQDLKDSKSWKATKPLRQFMKMVKK